MTSDIPGPGHNNPPEPTPFEVIGMKIADLYQTAQDFLDGEKIDNPGLAEQVEKLENMLKSAIKEADEARKTENKPFDDGKAAVQAKWNTLIGETKSVTGMAVLALETCKKALLPWRQKVQAEKDAAAKKAREEADTRFSNLRELQARADQANLAEQELISNLADEAQKADRIARGAEKATTHKTGIRVTYKAELLPGQLPTALLHIAMEDLSGMSQFAQEWADNAVRNAGQGAADMMMPGFKITRVEEAR